MGWWRRLLITSSPSHKNTSSKLIKLFRLLSDITNTPSHRRYKIPLEMGRIVTKDYQLQNCLHFLVMLFLLAWRHRLNKL